MPDFVLQFVYQLDDFDTSGSNIAVPNESGAQAAGNPPFQLQLDADASPIQVTVTDIDSDFDEINNTGQELTAPVTIDGVLYNAGSSIILNYVLTTADGFEGYSITIDAGNAGNNTTTAFVTNSPMVPGDVYIFTLEGNIGGGSRPYDQFACFMNGTRIETVDGPVSVEDLRKGQLLETLGGEYVPLKLVLRRKLSAKELRKWPNLRPIRMSQGALGDGLPTGDLLVSPQHRMVVVSPIANRMFGEQSVLVSAKKLTAVPGIFVDETVSELEYFHLVLEQHDIIIAEGAPTESFYCGEIALEGLSNVQRDELFQLFPALAMGSESPAVALPIPAGRRQKRLVSRHCKNSKELVCY